MTYTDTWVLESFTLWCLLPGMLHSPPSFEVCEPLLGKDKPVCTGYVSDPGELRSLSFFLMLRSSALSGLSFRAHSASKTAPRVLCTDNRRFLLEL